jgi:hypothetical protein
MLFDNPEYYNHDFAVIPDGLIQLPFICAVYSMANGDKIYMTADNISNFRIFFLLFLEATDRLTLITPSP